jgi:hypothetical protein
MSRTSKGSRLKLLRFDQDLIDRMHDFQEAYLDANEGTILAEALSAFIDAQVANNPDIKRRYEIARRRRGELPPAAAKPGE